MSYNPLKVEPKGEDFTPTIVEDIKITTWENGIVIYDSGFSQGDKEFSTLTTELNFDDTNRHERTEVTIIIKNPIPSQLNLSRIFYLYPTFEKCYSSDGESVP